ncbi:MAG: hypothetical protein ACLT8V_06500 [Streptococcus salivarius]
MNHLEIEYKTLLTKDEYNRLAMLFSHVTPAQMNYLLTPSGDMKSKSCLYALDTSTYENDSEIPVVGNRTTT